MFCRIGFFGNSARFRFRLCVPIRLVSYSATYSAFFLLHLNVYKPKNFERIMTCPFKTSSISPRTHPSLSRKVSSLSTCVQSQLAT